MRSRRKNLTCVAAAVSLLAIQTSFGQFEQANREYASGDFSAAVNHYQELVQRREYSASVFYNLGNAYFRLHDFGRAILNYERALALEPHHPEAEANLRVARDEARALELSRTSSSARFFHALSISQYSIIAAVSFWIALFAIAFAIFGTARRRLAIVTTVILLLVCGWAGFGAYQAESAASALAIVTGSDVHARVATADTANTVLTLPPGSEVRVIRARGDWVYTALPNDLLGWVPAKNIEPVRLN